MRASWVVGFVALTLLTPSLVWACAVCGTGPERSREAYYNMTALMTLLPLGVIGAFVYLLARRLRALDAEEESVPVERAAPAEPECGVSPQQPART